MTTTGPTHSPSPGGTRIVVVGKGGVGKTTIAATMARQLARDGSRVVAVDADEQSNLAATLGIDAETRRAIVPIADDGDYIEEKTGSRPGEGSGAMLVLNPDTRDLIDRLSVAAPDGVRLIVMGGLREAGSGCLCPETSLVSSAVAGMHLYDDDVIVMDTHAGVEHFGRSLARGFDTAVVVVDPTFNAVQVGVESINLAHELGIDSVHLAVNRTRSPSDIDRVWALLDELGSEVLRSVTTVPYDETVLTCEPSVSPLLAGSSFADAVRKLTAEVVGSHSLTSSGRA